MILESLKLSILSLCLVADKLIFLLKPVLVCYFEDWAVIRLRRQRLKHKHQGTTSCIRVDRAGLNPASQVVLLEISSYNTKMSHRQRFLESWKVNPRKTLENHPANSPVWKRRTPSPEYSREVIHWETRTRQESRCTGFRFGAPPAV